MSVTGKVRNGKVVLPAGTALPEGADVRIETLDTPQDPFVAAALKVAKPRPDWPGDYSLNHGHYVSGEPRKE